MMLDLFDTNPAFRLMELSLAMTKLPAVPTKLGNLGLFAEKGVRSDKVAVEMKGGVLTLVPTKPRGAPGTPKSAQKGNLRDFRAVHLPQTFTVMADELAMVREWGTEASIKTIQSLFDEKFAVVRTDLDITHEYQRMGAVKGQVVDADGTTVIYDWYTEFGVTKSTINFELDDANTNVLEKCIALKRLIKRKLGATMMSGVRVEVSPDFFDAFTKHVSVVETYKAQEGSVLRTDRRDGFEFGGIFWSEYDVDINGTPMIEAGKAHAIPMGVPDLFISYFAPAPYLETVNTVGQPFYAKQSRLKNDTGIEVETQSNPLHLCTRPEAVIELLAA